MIETCPFTPRAHRAAYAGGLKPADVMREGLRRVKAAGAVDAFSLVTNTAGSGILPEEGGQHRDVVCAECRVTGLECFANIALDRGLRRILPSSLLSDSNWSR